jgi:predicted ArsR family transcriptional regulator
MPNGSTGSFQRFRVIGALSTDWRSADEIAACATVSGEAARGWLRHLVRENVAVESAPYRKLYRLAEAQQGRTAGSE